MAKLYANYRIRVAKNQIKVLPRSFTASSQIKVQKGQEVTPEEIIVQEQVKGGFHNLDLAAALQVPASEVKKYLQRRVGQKIFKGELLAFKPATLLSSQKLITCPTDAVIASVDLKKGLVKLDFIPRVVKVPAAVFGVVEEIDQNLGKIYLKTEVTEIFGIAGSGNVREGAIHFVGRRGNITQPNQIKPEHANNVLVCGAQIYREALSACITMGVHGIITGGIDAKEYLSLCGGQLSFPRQFNTDVGISLIVGEGFGSIPLGQDIFDELEAYEGKFAIMNGNLGKITLPSFDESCMMMVRKTVLPTQASFVEAAVEPQMQELEIGQKVRIIAPPFMGEQGKVIAIDQQPSLLASGIKSFLLVVETLTRKLKVPQANVEIV